MQNGNLVLNQKGHRAWDAHCRVLKTGWWTRRLTYRKPQLQIGHVLKIGKSPCAQKNRKAWSTSPACGSLVAARNHIDYTAAVNLCKFDLEDTTAMGSVPYCPVRRNDNHRPSTFMQIKGLRLFIQIRACIFNHWRERKTGKVTNRISSIGTRYNPNSNWSSSQPPLYRLRRRTRKLCSSYGGHISKQRTIGS